MPSLLPLFTSGCVLLIASYAKEEYAAELRFVAIWLILVAIYLKLP